ncbi:MAG: hypothetical protein ACRCVG_05380 [Methanobacteriaceae archaeon]
MSSDISDKVLFKKNDGRTLVVLQKYVGLKSRDNGILTVNLRTPEKEMDDIKEFFEAFDTSEPFNMDIGDTGDFGIYFKGISPIIAQQDKAGFNYFFVSVTLQELKQEIEDNSDDNQHTCGCGL